MSGIVIVESSATLSHLLQRTLSAIKQDVERTLTTYAEASALLAEVEAGTVRFKVMVIGAPARHGADFEALLHQLGEGHAPSLAILILSHEKTPFLSEWLARRRNAFLLLWSNFGRIPAALKELMPPDTGAPEAHPEAPETASRAPAQSPLKVLFVDDSQSVRFAYRQLLENNGFVVDTAASVQEGFAKGQSGAYDLAIVDYYLPDGSGDELTRRLAHTPSSRNMPIAIITGSYKDAVIKKCLEAGAMECMFKNEVLELTLARIKALARTIQTQKSVEAERIRLDGILRSVGDGVYGVDGQGVITFANPAALGMLEYTEERSLIGRSAHQLIHHASEAGESIGAQESALAQAYAEGSELKAHEAVFWTRGSSPLPVECTVLPLAIQGRREGSVVVFRNISERKSTDKLRWELQHDQLTGLANRRYLIQTLSTELERRRERGGYSALLYIDIDRFNTIADSAGQQAADRVLVDVGQLLSQRLRHDDLLARLESDHYALLLSGVQLENLFTIADSLRELLKQVHFPLSGRQVPVTASVGVGILSGEAPSAEYVIEHARLACQDAKRRGRDQTQIYVAGNDARIARELDAGWIVRLKEALHEDRFRLLTQPILPVREIRNASEEALRAQGWRLHQQGTGEALFELLIRMVNRDGQVISPSVFVPLAERVGMMPKIDLWVVARAVRFLATLPPASRVALTVNLSTATLQDPDSLKLIDGMIAGSPGIASRLIFEVTETSEIDSLHSVRKFMQSLRKQGVRFALDDFGTGFSSISHLKHLPVDFVKIEGSLVSDVTESSRDRTMVSSMIALAHALELKVIAEHVDSPHTLSWLADCGADFAQGHFLGEPVRLDEIEFQVLNAPTASA
ncbi:MAG: EAL domain-containing protein [Rhodanobacteraceae bacterium]|nr:EAL domain-containing protein [Rhodanobacteraceae bacterium]